MACAAIQKSIDDVGSRGASQGPFDHMQRLLSDAEEVNERLAEGAHEDVVAE
jgi:hypothetical protein